MNSDEILAKFKKFETRSTSEFSNLVSRIKDNRKFVSGEQWSKDDDKFIARTRNRVVVNVISNQCNSVANQYAQFPFTWYSGDENIDKEIDQFFSTDSNRFAVEEALLDCVSFGMGVLALGSDKDAGGNEVPVIYSITDPDRVRLDPDSTELDGSDAMEGALIDYRSREWIRVNMGEQYLPGKREKMVCTCASCATLVPIITYYWLDTDGCHFSTFVNEQVVANPDGTIDIRLPFHRIPIFPVWGERTWDGDKQTYTGLIAKSETVQRIVNYSMTQLVERLALSPKPQWKGYLEQFKGLDKYFRRAGTGENSIIPGNRLANDNKTTLPLPERVDNQVQFGDVQGIIEGTMGMLSSITGVDSKGLADVQNDVTATAVLYTSKVFQNNIRHYFSHLRTSFKSLGDTVMVMMGHPGVVVDVAQGPDVYMENQVARQELTALMGVVEPNQKRAIVNAILRTHPDNETLVQLYADLNATPAPTPMEEQAMQTIQVMKQAIDSKDQQIMQLTAQLEQLKTQVENQDKSYRFDLLKAQQSHNFKMEEMALEAQLNQTPTAAAKAAAEVQKAEMGVEKEAISLEREREKAASEQMADQATVIDAMFGGI